jgi:hypothetical protein
VIKVIICLFGEKVKENSNKFLSHLAVVLKIVSSRPIFRMREGRRREEREERVVFFFIIKIMGWEALLLPNQKMQI